MGLCEVIPVKAVSQIIGVVIALSLLVPVIIGFLSLERSYMRQYLAVMRGYRERLDLVPHVNSTGIYISVMNPGPVEPVIVRYLIVKNISNGEILFVREMNKRLKVGDSLDVLLFNTTSICGKIDVMAVTLDGAVFHLDPEFVGSDGVLDESDIQRIMQSEENSTSFFINPAIGWAFNKTIIIRDGSGRLHYLIPYSVGNRLWANMVSDVVYAHESFRYTAMWHIYKLSEQKDYTLNKIEITVSKDKKISVYLYASDGTLIKAEENIPAGTTRRDWGLWLRLSGSSNAISREYYDIRAYSQTTWADCLSIETIDRGDYVEVSVYAGTYSYIPYTEDADITAKQYEFLYTWSTNGKVAKTVHADETVTVTIRGGYIASTLLDRYVSPGSSVVVYPGFTVTDGISFLMVVNPDEPYTASIRVPYISYDVYQPGMKAETVFSVFVRDADQRVGLDYTNYLLPGENYLEVNATVPEMYVLEISQPNTYLPSYWVLVSWLDPRLAVNITSGGSDLLVKYGLVETSAVITFLYRSIVFKNGNYLGTYDAGGSLTLSSGRYVIIPTEGSYKGNVFYLWVDNWELIRG